MKKTNQLSSKMVSFLLETFLVALLGIFAGGIQASNSLTVVDSKSGISCVQNTEKGINIETAKTFETPKAEAFINQLKYYTHDNLLGLVMNITLDFKLINNAPICKSTLHDIPESLISKILNPPRSDLILDTS